MTNPVITEAPSRRRPGVGWTELGLAVFAYIALQIALVLAWFAVTDLTPGPVPLLVGTALATFGAVAIALLPRIRSAAPLRLGNPGARWLWGGLAAGVGGLLVVRLWVVGWMLLTGDTSDPQAYLTDGLTAGGWTLGATIALGGLLIPLAEEMLFRGVVYSALRRYGIVVATLGSAAVFGVAHGFPVLIVAAFVIGVVNAVLMERSGSLWPAVITHATINTTTFVLIAVLT